MALLFLDFLWSIKTRLPQSCYQNLIPHHISYRFPKYHLLMINLSIRMLQLWTKVFIRAVSNVYGITKGLSTHGQDLMTAPHSSRLNRSLLQQCVIVPTNLIQFCVLRCCTRGQPPSSSLPHYTTDIVQGKHHGRPILCLYILQCYKFTQSNKLKI